MKTRDNGQELNFIDPKHLFRAVGDTAGTSETSDTSRLPMLEAHRDDEASVPHITRLPEGIEVIEQKVGRAIGNWILQVRCQCGRRWFELSPVDATHCPRCGMYVYIDVVGDSGPKG